jgi:hypothetical protein
MGAGPAGSNGGGRTDAGPKRTTATKIGVGNINEKGKLTGQYRSDNPTAFRNRGAEKIKKGANTKSVAVNAAVGVLSGPLQAGSKVSRDFFTDKVLGSKNYRNVSKQEFLSYDEDKQEMMFGSYMDKRTSGETDAYGNINPGFNKDDGGNNQPAQETIIKKNVGGTEVQTTQAKIDEQRAKDDEYDIRKVKKRGRRRNILTSSKGVTTVSPDYSLGKPSLLGSV